MEKNEKRTCRACKDCFCLPKMQISDVLVAVAVVVAKAAGSLIREQDDNDDNATKQ